MKDKTKRKIKNITICTLAFLVLNKGIKLVKGCESAKKIINSHELVTEHAANLVAHRGFSGMYPDNSYLAIQRAIDTPCVSFIEIDVRLTNDNTIVLHHDASIGIDDLVVSIASFNISDIEEDLVINDFNLYNLSDLTSNDLIFLFKRYLNKTKNINYLLKLKNLIPVYMNSTDKKLIIDIKTSEIDLNFMFELDKILSDYKDRIYLQTDCFDFLITMKNNYPDYKYLYIINSKKDLDKMDIDIEGFTIKYNLFNKINNKCDKIYFVYTINSSEKFNDLINNINYKQNVYIITDNPDYICGLEKVKVLEKR